MNPDIALDALLKTAYHAAREPEPQAQALAEMILELDEWLSRGGALPRRWGEPQAAMASSGSMVRYRGRLYCKIK